MNEPNLQAEQQEKPGDPSAWGYASGRISVLETHLLNRSFFESLARSRSLIDAQSLLAKTPYRVYFQTSESIANYSLTLDQAFTKIMEGILKDSPPHIMNAYFQIPDRYLYFRNLFIHFSARNASVQELEHTFSFLAENEIEQESVSRHRDLLNDHHAPGNTEPVARSLFLDSAVTALKLKIVSMVPEEKISQVLRDMTILESWTALLRNRWNGTDPEVMQKWFLMPNEYTVFVKNSALSALINPSSALLGFVSDGVYDRLNSVPVETLRQSVDLLIREAVRDDILQCRMVPFGPERVLSFYVSLRVEIENLRLALASVASGIESRIVIERFRREYA